MKHRIASLILGVVIMFTVLGLQLLANSDGFIKSKNQNSHNFKYVVEAMKSGMEKITTTTIGID